jgi:hypothetical protein
LKKTIRSARIDGVGGVCFIKGSAMPKNLGNLSFRVRKNRRFASSDSFALHLYSSFKAIYGPFLTFVGVVLAIITFFTIPATSSLPVRYAILVILIALCLIIWLFDASWSAFNRKSNVLPSVICAREAPKSFKKAIALLILESSEFFSYDSVVSIYSVENEIEILVGVGKVINIQENKKIQVLVTHRIEEIDWNLILQNNVNELRKLIIKPTVSSTAFVEATQNA